MPGRTAGLLLGCALLLGSTAASLAWGARPVDLADVVAALAGQAGTDGQIVVREMRLPRTVVGAVVGLALGIAGVLMQGLTRNPAADPGIFGVSAGAAVGVVAAITFAGVASAGGYVWFGVVGALVAAALVFGVAGRSPRAPLTTFVLAGAAVSATLGSLTASILAVDQRTLDQYRFWAVGSLEGRGMGVALDVLPLVTIGVALAGITARGLDSLALGEDVARALGRNVGLLRLGVGLAVVLLTGAAVAAAGPVAFVGLVVPHVVRPLAGSGHRAQILLAGVYAPSLVLTADVVGRLVARPAELPVGIVLAVVGAPVLIWVVRRDRRARRRRPAVEVAPA